MTTLERLKSLNQARSSGPWHTFGNTLYLRKVSPEKPGQENLDYHVFPGNKITADFIAAMANAASALLDVAEAAKEITNIYKALDSDIRYSSPEKFWWFMQKYCDEYGALKLAIARLEGGDEK